MGISVFERKDKKVSMGKMENTFMERARLCKNIDELKALYCEFDMHVSEEELRVLFQRIVMKEYVKLGEFECDEFMEFFKNMKAGC